MGWATAELAADLPNVVSEQPHARAMLRSDCAASALSMASICPCSGGRIDAQLSICQLMMNTSAFVMFEIGTCDASFKFGEPC